MKKILLFIFLGCSIAGKSQHFTGVTMVPAAPTDVDSITFYVDIMFPNSACSGSATSFVSGNNIFATCYHCMGMLTSICNDTDTIKVGPQPAGAYHLYLTLDAGMGGPPCSPPFVPNDKDTVDFTVTHATTTGVMDFGNDQKLSVYPNPAKGFVNIAWKGSIANPLKVNLLDETGRVVATENLSGSGITFKAAPGVYFVQVPEKGVCRKLVME